MFKKGSMIRGGYMCFELAQRPMITERGRGGAVRLLILRVQEGETLSRTEEQVIRK